MELLVLLQALVSLLRETASDNTYGQGLGAEFLIFWGGRNLGSEKQLKMLISQSWISSRSFPAVALVGGWLILQIS